MEQLIFEPKVLTWARHKAFGPIFEAVSSKLTASSGITLEKIQSWEKGILSPNFEEVEKLSKLYKRPLAVFFLSEPPIEEDNPPDGRTVGSKDNEDISYKGLLAIRKARRIQLIADTLYEALGERPKFKYPKVSLLEDPIDLAKRIRSDLGISIDKQKRISKFEDFFEYIRNKFEDTGVISVKMSSEETFPKADFRAFSFTNTEPYLIVINNSDYEGAKNFSLAHEYAHVLLRKESLCNDFKSFENKSDQVSKVESFCNRFAAELLVPEEDFLRENIGSPDTSELNIITERLARKYKVSRVVILRKLLTSRKISSETYKEKTSEWDKEIRPKKKGGIFSIKTAYLKNGKTYSSLVFQAYNNKKISHSNLSDYLRINRKHIKAYSEFVHENA